MPNIIRHNELAKELNISRDTLMSFFSIRSVNYSEFEYVKPEHILMAMNYFDYVNNCNADIFQGFGFNYFQNVIREINFRNNPTILTKFTDAQVKNICLKVNDSSTFKDASKFTIHATDYNNDLLRYSLHRKCMKALEEYGGEMMSFVLNLKYVNHSNNSNDINQKKSDFFFPDFYFITNNNRFYLRIIKRNSINRVEGGFDVYDKDDNLMCKVNEKGAVIERVSSERVISFKIFLGYINGIFTMNAGGFYSHCDVCGFELNDPISVSLGRGPSCRKAFPIH